MIVKITVTFLTKKDINTFGCRKCLTTTIMNNCGRIRVQYLPNYRTNKNCIQKIPECKTIVQFNLRLKNLHAFIIDTLYLAIFFAILIERSRVCQRGNNKCLYILSKISVFFEKLKMGIHFPKDSTGDLFKKCLMLVKISVTFLTKKQCIC